MTLRRIHITGGPGSGKTTAARRLSALLELPVHDLDGLSLETAANLSKAVDLAVFRGLMREKAASLAIEDAWISEGAYLDWTEPFFDGAELIIWLKVPWRVASYRILSRHFKATIARNNRWPGWRRLFRFWRWSAHYYDNRNAHGLNDYGTPNTLQTLIGAIERHRSKTVQCHEWKGAVRLIQEHYVDRTRA